MDDIEQITEQIKERAEKFGAYMKFATHMVASAEEDTDPDEMRGLVDADELKQQLKDGKVNVAIFTSFSLGELAFTPRVQDPIGVKEEDEFRAIMPTEGEMLRDKIFERLEQGLDPFGDD